MGFRIYVRHFRGANLGLPRPSLPWCFPIQGPAAAAAATKASAAAVGPGSQNSIHSSSKRKKELKASFSMGFRRYVRYFRGAILVLLRPSEAWCFAPGRWFFPWCFPIWGPDVKVAKIHSSSKRKKEPKASFSMGFRSYLGIFGVQFWGFSVLQRYGVSLPGGDFFHGVFPSGDQPQQQQKPLQ